jgi:hypothetical protein
VKADLSNIDSTMSGDINVPIGSSGTDTYFYQLNHTIDQNSSVSDGENKTIPITVSDGINTVNKTISGITIDNNPPTVPDNVQDEGNTTTDKSLTFTWDSSTDTISNQNSITYNVQIATDASDSSIIDNALAYTNSFTFNKASVNKEYFFRVQAVDDSGNKSSWSSWTDGILVTGSLQLSNIREYKKDDLVYRNGGVINLRFDSNAPLDVNDTEIDFSNIDDANSNPIKNPQSVPNTSFTYQVQRTIDFNNSVTDGGHNVVVTGVDDNGNSVSSSIELFLDNSVPDPVSVSDNGDTIGDQPKFTWTESSDNVTVEKNIEFELQIATDNDPSAVEFHENIGTSNSYRYRDAEPEVEYFARVRPVDGLGNKGNWSGWTDGVVWDVPPMVLDLQLKGSLGKIIAKWTNPIRNLTEIILVRRENRFPQDHTDGQEIYRNTLPDAGEPDQYEDTSLDSEKQYYYGVFGKSPAGYWNDKTPYTGDVV